MPRVSKGLFVGSFALIGALVGFYVQDKLLKQLEERGKYCGARIRFRARNDLRTETARNKEKSTFERSSNLEDKSEN